MFASKGIAGGSHRRARRVNQSRRKLATNRNAVISFDSCATGCVRLVRDRAQSLHQRLAFAAIVDHECVVFSMR